MIHESWRPIVLAVVLLVGTTAQAADNGPDPREMKAVVDKAVAFLKSSQGQDGSYSPRRAGPGISAVVAAALLRNGLTADEPVVARTLTYLEKSVKKDGGIYDRFLANYTTSVAIMAFAEANSGGKYDTLIKKATGFLRQMQFDDSKVESGDAKYGGVGYDGKMRPDLSNTQYFLDALQAAGVPKNDPAVQNALKFVSRCQNLPGEHNDLPFAKKASEEDKGGLVYNPIDQDNQRDLTPTGGLRSAGAMTYAGLKSFLYAGVSKNDERVKAALKWIRARLYPGQQSRYGPGRPLLLLSYFRQGHAGLWRRYL